MPAIDPRAPTRICHRLILAFSLAAAACAPAAPSAQFPARPPGCALEAIERLPQRPYVELETFSLPGSESMRDVLDIVNERACRDGADAVYAPKGGRSYSYAIALKWNDAPRPAGPAPAPSASPAPPPPAPPPPPPSPPAPPSPPSPPPAPSSAPQPPAPAPPAPAPPAPPGA